MAEHLKIEGREETARAFNQVKAQVDDFSQPHKAVAEMIIPDIRNLTRKSSGLLEAGWHADSIATAAQFVNDVEYAGVQEFGWSQHNIEPTNAILQAFESNEKRTEALYGDAIAEIGRKAGFETNS